jgi:sugar phosphate isomerase/epimerase
MKLSLCNEVLRDLPFTLGEEAYRMGSAERASLRRAASDAGIAVSGLHWLLVAPPGLSITTADRAAWEQTVDVMRRLVDLCAELGGTYLVHGSHLQRRLDTEVDPAAAVARGEAAWAAVASDAEGAGVVYCIEPLSPAIADFVNTVAEAAAIVERIGHPALRTMIDASAAAGGEAEPFAALIARWMPTGLVRHIHLNDRNRRGPGQGTDLFAPALLALKQTGYQGWVGIEPFDYVPDGPTCAARSIGYVSGILEALPDPS